MSIVELKTFRVSCDWCPSTVDVDGADAIDAVIAARLKGWRFRDGYEGTETLCSGDDHPDYIGTGWK